MVVGLSTYAFFWRWSEAVSRPLTLHEMLDETHRLGATVLQICDCPLLTSMRPDELRAIRAHADTLGISLELGTRGISASHLDPYRELAIVLGANFVRTVINAPDHRPSLADATELLRRATRQFTDVGITLGLETYEEVATADLVALVNEVGSEHLGICLDTANCVARLELPADVARRAAAHVVNMHVKDFTFLRQPGLVGFSLIGCPLGTGLLDYDMLVSTVEPASRGIHQIIEHWLPWTESIDATCHLEAEWTAHSVNFLRKHDAAQLARLEQKQL